MASATTQRPAGSELMCRASDVPNSSAAPALLPVVLFGSRRAGRPNLEKVIDWLRNIAVFLTAITALMTSVKADDTDVPRLNPATWGSDHAGQPFPEYITGDECLFCHRTTGADWGNNRHQLTLRPATPDEPAIRLLHPVDNHGKIREQAEFVLGSRRATRFLKRSDDYGKLEVYSVRTITGEADENDVTLNNANIARWERDTFGNRCAGCHTTAVDTLTRAFSSLSLDCFVCHGDVSLEHTDDIDRVLLSKTSRNPRQVVSICGQCHLRGGRSKSSGLPWPNTFVAGDNLFRDFQVDFADEAIAEQPKIDEHIFLNVRDVAISGHSPTTCLTCHDVHGQNTEKHRMLDETRICSSCHIPGTENTPLRPSVLPANRLRTHSSICDY